MKCNLLFKYLFDNLVMVIMNNAVIKLHSSFNNRFTVNYQLQFYQPI